MRVSCTGSAQHPEGSRRHLDPPTVERSIRTAIAVRPGNRGDRGWLRLPGSVQPADAGRAWCRARTVDIGVLRLRPGRALRLLPLRLFRLQPVSLLLRFGILGAALPARGVRDVPERSVLPRRQSGRPLRCPHRSTSSGSRRRYIRANSQPARCAAGRRPDGSRAGAGCRATTTCATPEGRPVESVPVAGRSIRYQRGPSGRRPSG